MALQSYKTGNYLMLYGDDIYFSEIDLARQQFQLIEAMRAASPEVNIQFATIQDYLKAVMAENKTYSTFEGDFVPYVSYYGDHLISWTGFYSSRPFQKSQTYLAHSLVRAAEITAGLVENHEFIGYESCNVLHHDAITGTCKPYVSEDYFRRIYEDQASSLEVIADAYSSMVKPSKELHTIRTPYKAFVVQNPVNWVREEVMYLDSTSAYTVIQISTGQVLTSQSVPFGGAFRIYFKIILESLSFTTVFMSEQDSACDGCSSPSSKNTAQTVSNGVYAIDFNYGLIDKISRGSTEMHIYSEIVAYNASFGGAYIFKPVVIHN